MCGARQSMSCYPCQVADIQLMSASDGGGCDVVALCLVRSAVGVLRARFGPGRFMVGVGVVCLRGAIVGAATSRRRGYDIIIKVYVFGAEIILQHFESATIQRQSASCWVKKINSKNSLSKIIIVLKLSTNILFYISFLNTIQVYKTAKKQSKIRNLRLTDIISGRMKERAMKIKIFSFNGTMNDLLRQYKVFCDTLQK